MVTKERLIITKSEIRLKILIKLITINISTEAYYFIRTNYP